VRHLSPAPQASWQQGRDQVFPPPAWEKSFKARKAIPAAEEPPDDTWKLRHADQRRQARRVRRAERAAHDLLHSRGFALARAAMILISGALLVWLFHYLQSHQWRLPGTGEPVAEDKAGFIPARLKPAGVDPNEWMADDDTELPAAAAHTPAELRSTALPVAAPR
jgi:hypothetical protein